MLLLKKGYDGLAEKPPWGFVDIFLVFLGIYCTRFVIYGLTLLFPALKAGFGLGETGYFLFAYLIQFLITIALVYLFAVVFSRGSWAALGVKFTGWRNILLYGVLGGVFLIIVITLLGFVIKQFQPELPPQYYEQILRTAGNLAVVLMIIFAGVVLAPLSEELFYRGMVYPVFRGKLGPVWGAVLAGLVFGAVHGDPWRAIPLSIGGAILCYFYEKTDSILVPAMAHGIWNGLMSLVVYLSLANGLL